MTSRPAPLRIGADFDPAVDAARRALDRHVFRCVRCRGEPGNPWWCSAGRERLASWSAAVNECAASWPACYHEEGGER